MHPQCPPNPAPPPQGPLQHKQLTALSPFPQSEVAKLATLRDVEPLAAPKYSTGGPDDGDTDSGAAAGLAAAEALLKPGPYTAAEVEAAIGWPLAILLAGNAAQGRALAAAEQCGAMKRGVGRGPGVRDAAPTAPPPNPNPSLSPHSPQAACF